MNVTGTQAYNHTHNVFQLAHMKIVAIKSIKGVLFYFSPSIGFLVDFSQSETIRLRFEEHLKDNVL